MNVRQWSRLGGVTLAAVAAVSVLSACGGSSAKTTQTANATPGGQASLQAYVTCLNQNGVKITLPSRSPGTRPTGTFPSRGARPSRSPGSGNFGGGGFGGGGFGGGFGGGLFGDANNPPTGVDATTWKNALAACKSVQPSFGGGGNFGGGANSTAFQAYRNCLASHGVSASAGPTQLNTANPTVAAAMKTCAPLRPTGRPTVAPSPTS